VPRNRGGKFLITPGKFDVRAPRLRMRRFHCRFALFRGAAAKIDVIAFHFHPEETLRDLNPELI